MNNDNPNGQLDKSNEKILADIERKAQRRLRRLRHPTQGVWYGLGAMGVVGWAVAIPTLAGILAGIWLDENFPVSFSWLLTGLVAGVSLGCFNAWHWINNERKKIQERRTSTEPEEL